MKRYVLLCFLLFEFFFLTLKVADAWFGWVGRALVCVLRTAELGRLKWASLDLAALCLLESKFGVGK